MSEKVKKILYYVFAGLFVVIALTALILGGLGVQIPTWLTVVLAVVEVALCVSDATIHKLSCYYYDVELQKAEEKIQVLEDEVKLAKAAAAKKAAVKKVEDAEVEAPKKTVKRIKKVVQE